MKRCSFGECFAALGILTLSANFCFKAAAASADQNWPQWRGPHQDGVAPNADPPTTWDETKNIKWKYKIPGEGSATPIVWENKVFIQTAIATGKRVEGTATAAKDQPRPGGQGGRGRGGGMKPTEVQQFALLCLDRASGKVLWQQVAREEVPHEGFREGDGNFASPSGLTDGNQVYAYFGSHGVYCYDLDGKQQWSKDLGKMRIALGFGEGSSPTLYKNALIVNWDNEDGSFITALDKSTGKELWKEKRDERTSWSTPLVIERDEKAQVVVTATGKIRSYDVDNGKVIWECGGLTRNVIPSPVSRVTPCSRSNLAGRVI
jgi:outer membrane protein assembly factor BamB